MKPPTTTTPEANPFKGQIHIILDSHDQAAFRRELKKKNTTPTDLLNGIVHAWATHPARSLHVIALPPEVSVLYRGESLSQYLTRVSISLIRAVLNVEGNVTKTARRLHYDRTSLHKLFSRLTNGTKISHHRSAALPEQPPSLEVVKRQHVLRVLEHCHGNKEEAISILGISRKQLDTHLQYLTVDRQ